MKRFIITIAGIIGAVAISAAPASAGTSDDTFRDHLCYNPAFSRSIPSASVNGQTVKSPYPDKIRSCEGAVRPPDYNDRDED